MLFFLKRRVFAIVINILMVALGFISLSNLKIREYPAGLSQAAINVEIEYPGASPRSVKKAIATPLIDEITSLSGLEKSELYITPGMLKGTLRFKSDVSQDAALINVISKIDSIINQFPHGLRRPIIRKADDSSAGSISIALVPRINGESYTSSGLAEILSQYVKNFIESIPGVASVMIPGATGSELNSLSIDVFLKPEALVAYRLTPGDVFRAISDESQTNPAGEFKIGPMFYSVQFAGSLNSIEEFGNIVIKDKVRVKDIAELKLNADKDNTRLRYNGQVCAFGYVKLAPNANIIDVSNQLRDKLNSLKDIIPDSNLDLTVCNDDSIPIQQSIKRVYWTIIEAIVIVAFIVLFFLKTWRFAAISLITIPICIITGFFILYMFGFSINMLTLFAIVLAIGLVVDDAIIVCERIHIKMHEGLSLMEACNKGIEEIQFSILAMTFTLASVYAPIGFAKGFIGRLFIEFAVLLAGTVIISGIVAYVLTPVMCSLMLSSEDEEVSVVPIKSWNQFLKKPIVWFDKFIDWVESAYTYALNYALHNRFVVLWGAIVLFLLSLVCAGKIRSITSPAQDKNSAIITMQLPPKSDVKSLPNLMEKIENMLSLNKNVESYTTEVSQSESVRIFLNLIDLSKRHKNDRQIANEIKEEIEKQYAYGRIMTSRGSYSPFSKDNRGFSVELRTDLDTELLSKVMHQLVSRIPELGYNAVPSYSRLDPQRSYAFIVDREKAYELGIKFTEIVNDIVNIMMGNPPAKRYFLGGKQRSVRVRTSEEDRTDLNLLNRFYARSSKLTNERDDKELVPFSSFIERQESYEVQHLQIHNGLETGMIWLNLDPKIDQTKAFYDLKKLASDVMPSKGFTLEPSDELRRTIDEQNTAYFIGAIAIIFVYLFMAALFESFLSPFIVICTVPLAIAGAIFSIWLSGWGSFNIWSYVGIFTLIGLITKNGILLVDFFNKEMENSNNVFRCALRCGQIRFRPILMTTIAMIASSVTLTLGHGIGFELMREIGLVVAGGLTFGTVLTLFLVPCLCVMFNYDFVSKKRTVKEEQTPIDSQISETSI